MAVWWVGGVGDCRAVVGTREGDGSLQALALTTDHKCDLPSEQTRIESYGGYVRPASFDEENFAPARVYRSQKQPWLGPGLCIARVLGDFDGGDCGLIATPEVHSHTVRTGDQFLLIASDGVWEFIDNEEAVVIVERFYNKTEGDAPVVRGAASEACAFLVAKV